MSLIVYNGSPRGEKSNSSVITSWFLEGYGNSNTEIRFLKKFKQHLTYAQEMIKYDEVLMVFPLYIDGMPGQVKRFFEIMSSLKDKLKDKHITFIIHSGFSDGIQSKALEQYCIRLSKILNLNNHGVIIIPGSEGFRLMPPVMTKKKRIAVANLGSSYKANEQYSEENLKFLYGKEKSSKFDSFMLR
ncbi:MAG: NAD(P)H-dependent oxidoreductase, partial [Tenericutes bacterium]|nr:NAD(P)H-dependent oxidoreductase [Mycoplasmatota bacterium]